MAKFWNIQTKITMLSFIVCETLVKSINTGQNKMWKNRIKRLKRAGTKSNCFHPSKAFGFLHQVEIFSQKLNADQKMSNVSLFSAFSGNPKTIKEVNIRIVIKTNYSLFWARGFASSDGIISIFNFEVTEVPGVIASLKQFPPNLLWYSKELWVGNKINLLTL